MKKLALKALIISAVLAPTGLFAQNLLLNGDFELGNLNYWHPYATSTGTLGSGLPNVVSFNTTGTGSTAAAQFQVGETVFDSTPQGGGIYQAINCSAGLYDLSANIAAANINNLGNSAAGLFSILIDSTPMTGLDLGPINAGLTLRGNLDTTVSLSGGLHIFSMQITRPYISGGGFGNTPLEYLDNISVVAVPEPASLLPLGFAALVLIGLKRKVGRRSPSAP